MLLHNLTSFNTFISFTGNAAHFNSLSAASVPLTLREKNDEALKLPDSEPKIAGGAEATSNAFPYQVRTTKIQT
jgi:hypothetical protein